MRRHFVVLVVASLLSVGCGSEAEQTRVTLLGTTDVHGYLMPWDYPRARPADGSLTQVATLVRQIRADDPATLLLDSGDFLQGSELTDHVAATGIDGVHPVIAAMNALAYDAVAVGNHEYNHGLPFLHEALADADFPLLSANTYEVDTGSPAFAPYTVVERGGVRVGILGLTTPGVAIWDRDHVEGRLRFDDIVESARRWMPELLAEDPDLVVVVAHSGIGPGSTYSETSGVPEEDAVGRLAEQVDGIDVIFAGHSAGPVPGRDIGGSHVIHAGHRGAHLAVVEVTLERSGSGGAGWQVVDRTSSLLDTEAVTPDPELEDVVGAAHERTLAWLEETVGHTPDRWSAAEARVRDTAAGDLITAAMREAAGTDLASTPILDPSASFGPGPITRRDVLALYVYPNRLKAIRVTGEQLRAYLEQSARYFNRYPADELVDREVIAFNYDVVDGVEYGIDLSRPVGERLVALRYRGEPVAAADTFVLAINSYRQAGGGGFEMLTGAQVVYSDDSLVSELIVEFIRRRDTLRAADVLRENWHLEPEAAVRRLIETGATLPRF